MSAAGPTANRGGEAMTTRLPTLFPAAAQPDIVRASQKDALYLQHLTDSCHDAVRRLLGVRQALKYSREVQLVAELLYSGLTTGAGLQTLGEEYCDIIQAAGPVGVAPSLARRSLLILLEKMAPYLAEHLSHAANSSAGAVTDNHGTSESGSSGRTFAEAQQPPAAAAQSAATGPGLLDAAAVENHREGATSTTASGRGGPLEGFLERRAAWSRVGTWAEAARDGALRAASKWQPAWVVLATYAPVAARLHLALFYFYGVYYHWAKRATGTRYLFVGKLYERRPSYHLLGVLLFVQLGISAGSWALSSLTASLGNAGLLERNQDVGAHTAKALQAAVVLQDDNDEEVPSAAAIQPPEHAPEVPPHRRCALCLAARTAPTATPCGHVFCWQCIADWHHQKAECPLCRSPFSTSGLVPIYNSDF